VDSPVTQAIGVGINGPVGDGDLQRLEEFFRSRGAAVAVELSPFVDSSLYEAFGKRGYRLREVSNVLVRQLGARDRFDGPQDVVVRPMNMNEAQSWVETVAKGFAEDFPVTESLLDVMQGFLHRRVLLSSVRRQGSGRRRLCIVTRSCRRPVWRQHPTSVSTAWGASRPACGAPSMGVGSGVRSRRQHRASRKCLTAQPGALGIPRRLHTHQTCERRLKARGGAAAAKSS
jgi:hypothetical protein